MKTITIASFAKINLTLEIINKREDGYHNIESIMQSVDLYDVIKINISDSELSQNIIEIAGNSKLIPYDNTNLAYISAEKFLNTGNIHNKKIQIYIQKNIPIAAGLAGGSSNAAGVLYGLNEIFNQPLNKNTLLNISSQIGADVSFCLDGGTKLATQKGEELKNITTPELNIIIAKPKNLFISAKEAYQEYSHLTEKPEHIGFQLILKALNKNDSFKIASLLKNDLELPIESKYSEINILKQTLKAAGCINTLMSGSGPTVFGIYKDKFDLNKIDQTQYDVFQTKTINYSIKNL